jgi:hypothetical protein
MSRLTALLKAVPLCCGLMFVAAAEDECVIRIVTDDGDGDECEAVDEVCNLDCVLATNEEGCEICECATEPPPPEGCESDADCRDGQICVSQDGCPPCAADPNQPCDIACTFEGVCVDVNPDPCAAVLCSPDTVCAVDENGQAVCLPIEGELCFADSDCGERAFCDFSTCNGGGSDGNDGNEPAPPDDGDQDIACLGTCRELDEPFGCENVLCDDGSICVEGFNGPECVPVESQCNTDEDCAANGQGGRCEISCLPMPDCPECDACLVVGQCVNDDICAQLCGPGQECQIDADGSVSCGDVRPPECTSDADCESGNCNADEICLSDPACEDPDGNGFVACDAVCWGYCEQPQPTSCFEDAECGDGEICELRETCLPCEDDPNGQGCEAPCFVEGVCVQQ